MAVEFYEPLKELLPLESDLVCFKGLFTGKMGGFFLGGGACVSAAVVLFCFHYWICLCPRTQIQACIFIVIQIRVGASVRPVWPGHTCQMGQHPLP